MKKLFLFLFSLVFILVFNTQKAKASHAMGADISYQCVGGNVFRVKLAIYRDCSGISITPSVASVNFSSASCGQNFNITLDSITAFWGIDVSPYCPAQASQSNCNAGGTLPGVEMYIFEKNITLPTQCNDWVIGWGLCCRNDAITNLQNPGSNDLYVEAKLNNLNVTCNSSPEFTNLPVPYICNGQLYNYNHGAYDIDGDSLVYQNIQPLNDNGSTIAYTTGRSVTSPMITSGYSFDPLTGQYALTPSANQNAVLTVRVLEYRNGVLIGSTMRDIQVKVIACTNNQISSLASIDNFQGAGTLIDANSFQMCSGQFVSFDVTFKDPDSLNLITVFSNIGQVLPGAVLTTTTTQIVNSQAQVVASINWTPTLADAGFHVFTISAKDDACPVISSQTYSFDVTVYKGEGAGLDLYQCSYPDNSKLNIGFSEKILCSSLELADLELLDPNGNPIDIISINSPCSSGDTATQFFELTVNPPMTLAGNYQLNLVGPVRNTIVNVPSFCIGLDFRDTLRFFYAPGGIIDDVFTQVASDTLICEGYSVDLDVSTLDPNGTFTYLWDGQGLSSSNTTIKNPSALPPNNFNGYYYVTVRDVTGCIQRDSVKIRTQPSPQFNMPSDTSLCFGDTIFFDLNVPDAIDYFWSGNGTFSNQFVNNPYFIPANSGSLSVEVTNDIFCSTVKSFGFVTTPSPQISFVTEPASICLGDSMAVTIEVEEFPAIQLQCGTGGQAYPCANQQNFVVGSLTSTNVSSTTSTGVPYGNYYWGNKQQMIVLASELTALGMGRGYINSLGFSVSAAYTGAPLQNFTIRMACTNQSSFPSTSPSYISGLSTVLNPITHTPVVGTNTHVFDAPYFWDGTSNLVIETCFANTSFNVNAIMRLQTTSYNSTIYYRQDSGFNCSSTSASALTYRPVMIFNGCQGGSGALVYNFNISPSTSVRNVNANTYMVAPNATSTYTVQTTNIFGCDGKANLNVNVAPNYAIDAFVVTGDTLKCKGDSLQLTVDGNIPTGSTYTWTSSGAISNPTSQNPYALTDTISTYYVIVSSPAGCTKKDSVKVSSINFKIPAIDTICYGTTTQLNVQGFAGTTFNWTPSAGLNNSTVINPTASPEVSTTYILEATYNDCISFDSVRVNIKRIETQITPNTTICKGQSVSLNVIKPAPIVYPTTCGTQTVTCNQTLNAWIGNPSSTTFNGTTSYPAPYGNYWYGARHQMIIRASELTAAGFKKGNINNLTFKVQNTNGSPALQGYTIKIGCTNKTAFTTSDAYESGLVTVFGPVSYTPVTGDNTHNFNNTFYWNGTSNIVIETCFNNTAFTSNASMYYTTSSYNSVKLYRADASGVCNNTSTTEVSANRPIIRLNGCGVEPPQYNFTWAGGTGISNPNISNPTITPTATTTYYVNMVNPVGCDAKDSITITVVDLSLANAIKTTSDSIYCPGESVQLDIQNYPTGANVIWSPANAVSNSTIQNPMVTQEVNNVFVATLSHSAGCTRNDTVIVLFDPAFTAFVGTRDTAACEGNSIDLSINGAPTGSTFIWTPNVYLNNNTIPNPTFNIQSDTMYYYTTTTPAGCSKTDSVFISLADVFDISLNTNSETICKGDSILLVASGAPSGSTYTWSPSTGVQNQGQNSTYVLPDSTVNYQITALSPAGCVKLDSVLVNVFALATPNATVSYINGADSTCQGEIVQLNVDTTGIPNGTIYVWTPATTSNTPNTTITATSNTTYTLQITTPLGCKDEATAFIKVVQADDVLALGDDTLCSGEVANISVSGGNGVYAWYPTAGLDNPNGATTVANPTTSTTYYVESDYVVCKRIDSVRVLVDQFFTTNSVLTYSTISDSTCQGEPVTMTMNTTNAPTGTTYSWAPTTGLDNPTSNTVSFTAENSQQYIVTATTPLGCKEMDTLQVNVVGVAVIASDDDTLCFGESAKLLVRGGNGSFTWTPSLAIDNVNSNNPTVNPTTTQTYVVYSDFGVCKRYDSVKVYVARDVKATATASVMEGPTPLEVTFTNTSIGAVSYQWLFGDGVSISTEKEPIFTYYLADDYTVKLLVEGDYGCKDSLFIGPIRVGGFNIPNVITKNGDGINDYFEIVGLEKNCKLRIVNRWGNTMYNTDNYDNKWDAEGVSEGVYFYELTFTDGRFYKGWIQVMK